MVHHKEGCTCGSRQCSQWMLLRLETVSPQLEVLEGDYGIDPLTAAQLTGLDTDTPAVVRGVQGVYRDGYFFAA